MVRYWHLVRPIWLVRTCRGGILQRAQDGPQCVYEASKYRSSLADYWIDFEKANEIYFRLGIIYKHQRKYSSSLEVSSCRLSEHSEAEERIVLPVHPQQSSSAIDLVGHLVPARTRLRAGP